MRLTCPNCGAQYEVPDEVIPKSGRDVQCSNCGDTWFQHHPDHIPEPEEDDGDTWDAPPEIDDLHDDSAEEYSRQSNLDDPDEFEPDEDTSDDLQESELARKELDPSVASVLREEAERERAARALESATGLETQPELGIDSVHDDADKRSAEAQARMARLRGVDEAAKPESDADDGPDPGTRRSLLPDIDELNSSLNANDTQQSSVHAGDAAAAAGASKSGFRSGFRTIILIALLGLILYLFAPQIAQTIPALEGPLQAYVEIINGLRVWLDQMVGGFWGGQSAES